MSTGAFANPIVSDDVTGVIESSVRFEGILTYSGTVHIHGTVIGKVQTPDILVVGATGRVRGEIEAGVVVIYGEVEGQVRAHTRVEIHKPAVFRGEMATPSLLVEEGVVFEGSNTMITEALKP